MVSQPKIPSKNQFGIAVLLILLALNSLVYAQPAIDVPALLDFSSTPINTTSNLTLTVGNTGPDTLVVSSIVTSFAEFTSSLATLTIPQNDSADVIVTYSPVSPGQKNKTLTLTHNGPSSPTTVSVKGRGQNVPVISSPASVDFGDVVAGTAGSSTVAVSNTGTNTLTVSAIALTGANAADFAVTPASLSVAAGDSADLTITFTPSVQGGHAATLTLTHNAAGGSSDISLSGTGLVPQISTVSVLDIGSTRVATSASGILTVTNPGTATLTVSATSLSGGNAADFTVTPTSLSVGPGASADLTVTFTPSASGARSGTLTLSHDADSFSTAISLAGQGTSSLISAVSSLSLGNSSVSVSTTGTLTVSNPGDATLNVSTIALSGENVSAFTVSAASLSISPGDAADLTITFTPSVSGGHNSTLTLTHDAVGGSTVIALSGTGDDDSTDPDATVIPATIVVASSLEFGHILAGESTSQLLTVRNSGTSNLSITSIYIQGKNSGDFGISETSAVLSPGGALDVKVTFRPFEPGGRAASLVLTQDGVDSPFTIALAGVGVGPRVSAPSELDFGTTDLADPVHQNVRIANAGNAVLTINEMGFSDSDAEIFTVEPGSAAIAPGAFVDFRVGFAPDRAGAHEGRLSFAHNGREGSWRIGVTGVAEEPLPTETPSHDPDISPEKEDPAPPVHGAILTMTDSLDLGAIRVGETRTRTLTVTNSGDEMLLIGNISVQVSDTGSVSVDQRSLQLEPGATGNLTVSYGPRGPVDLLGEIILDCGDDDGLCIVSLTGTGLQPLMDVAAGSIDVGWAPIGQTTSTYFLVRNLGNLPLQVAQAGTRAIGFTVSPESFDLAAGEAQLVTVGFTASSPGTTTYELVLEHNGPGGSVILPLKGKAVSRTDFDGDGITNFSDWLLLVTSYEKRSPGADLDGDGIVNFADVLVFFMEV